MVNWDRVKIESFNNDLLSYYDSHKRDLPWRQSNDAYKIWISEIMLQQTQVNTVIDYYNTFMAKYPDVFALASANEEELLKIWEGLGYYSRARNLQVAAKQVVDLYDGIFPSDRDKIGKLKGIGPYTSAAIASMAFNQAYPAIDGNLMRVSSRLFKIKDDIAKAASRKVFDQVLSYIISIDRPGDFNQALMDLGSSICSPTSPDCMACPISQYCLSYQDNSMLYYPVKKSKLVKKDVYYNAYAFHYEGSYYMVKRDKKGLLHNMWTFPLVEINAREYKDLYSENIVVGVSEYIGTIKHVFTHLIWHINVFLVELDSKDNLMDKGQWIDETLWKERVFPKAQIKMYELLDRAK